MLWPFHYHSSYDTFKCGMGPGAALWDSYKAGGTYCRSSETFYVKPTSKRACLGDFVASLACEENMTVCRIPENSVAKINGNIINSSDVYLSPFDSKIIGGKNNTACTDLFNDYYYGGTSLSITFHSTQKTIMRSKDTMVSSSTNPMLHRGIY